MRRLRISLAVAVLAGGFGLVGFANPDCAFACSCIQPKPIAEYKGEPDTLILKGTVAAYDANSRRGVFRVAAWYQGSSDVAEIPIQGGDGADCGIPLVAGQQLVVVAYASEGVLVPNICSPFGDLSTPEGQALDAETVAAYGVGTSPGGDELPPTEPGGGFEIPAIVPIAGGAIVAVIGIVAFASFVSGRRAT
ncbi:MAG: hypothetical protein L0227_06130 [Chloroflexi bacterium]|nr:hypothetical protein [Chloroflexota bacterium]